MEPEAPVEEAPEALLEVRRRVREAESRGVDVLEAKRLLVSALLAFRSRKLEEMGDCIRGAAKALEEGESSRREEVLRKRVWALREDGGDPERLAAAEAALDAHRADEAEAVLSALKGASEAPARAPILLSDVSASLVVETRTWTVVLSAGGSGTLRPLDVKRGEAAPEEVDAAVVEALRSLRPRPSVVHAALPHAAHVLAPVSLPPDLPEAEREQAIRWKLAKLCDLPADDVEVRFRPAAAGGSTLGMMSLRQPVKRILSLVSSAGYPVGRILPPSEILCLLLPPGAPRETRAVLEIRRDSAHVYLYGASGLAFSRDLGVGSGIWIESLGTPVSSTRGILKLTETQAREVLSRFDISRPEDLVLEDGTVLGGQDILSLLRPSLERLQDALARSIEFSGTLEGLAPATGVALCGEGASLRGLDRLLSERVGLPVAPMDVGARFPSPAGASLLSSADVLAASLLAARESSPFDLSPSLARLEGALSRASRPVLAAGAVAAALALGFGGYSMGHARHCRAQLEGIQENFKHRQEELSQSRPAGLPAAHPRGTESPAGRVLRELSLALPTECVLSRISLAVAAGGGLMLEFACAAGPDPASVLGGHPLFSLIEASGEGRYRCPIPEDRLR